jgi:DnaJ-class molecular chaperone
VTFNEQVAINTKGSSLNDELVFKLKPLEGSTCPSCHGLGTYADGMLCVGGDEIRYRPATPCGVCNGKGRVNIKITPLE